MVGSDDGGVLATLNACLTCERRVSPTSTKSFTAGSTRGSTFRLEIPPLQESLLDLFLLLRRRLVYKMAPLESEVLANYLLRPSALTSILTFEQFQSFFPDQLHDSSQLRSLFRDLRAQRDVVLAGIEGNIEEEARRGNVMRKEVLKARQGAEAAAEEDVDGEVELERAVRSKTNLDLLHDLAPRTMGLTR